MEAVDGADVGEDSLNDFTGKGGARPSLLQESGTENLQVETRGEEGDKLNMMNRFIICSVSQVNPEEQL